MPTVCNGTAFAVPPIPNKKSACKGRFFHGRVSRKDCAINTSLRLDVGSLFALRASGDLEAHALIFGQGFDQNLLHR
jgi:hypothetical protein